MGILENRYASSEMIKIFSENHRYLTWRKVWISLAEAQLELNYPIDSKALNKVKETQDIIDFDRVKEIESETRHDVMAHLKYWAEICPEVGNAIHLGATSCYVTDNSENILNKEALILVRDKLKTLILDLADKAENMAGDCVIGYTHFQPASPTTNGKRIVMWVQDLYSDYVELSEYINSMPCRGAKGTTGTQMSYLALANRDVNKTLELDKLVAKKLGFSRSIDLSGQTITRKADVKIGDLLSNLAVSFHKMGNDIRLLSNTGDLMEGFREKQIGSSAMPYKRNPMLSERLCSLSRAIPQYRDMIVQTAMTQWLERSLDDSAIRRIALPDMFMAVDGTLNVASAIAASLKSGKPKWGPDWVLSASEILLAEAVKSGFDRQLAHEKLKEYALDAKNNQHPISCFIKHLEGDQIWRNNSFVKDLPMISYERLVGLAEVQTLNYVNLVRSKLS